MADDKPAYEEGVSPDSLMGDFRGRSVMTIVIFTVIIHVVIIGTTSFGYLKTEVFGATEDMTKEQRIEAAVKEATSSIRELAEKYELSPQEISDRFAKSGSRTDKAMDGGDSAMDDPGDRSGTTAAPPADGPEEPAKPL